MKYMGSKNRIAKFILPIMLEGRRQNQWYVEPFCGGCNVIDKVNGDRIANDINHYLIEMWKALQNGWIPPMQVSREKYQECKEGKCDDALRGYVGFNCSYCGKWFGGYAGRVTTKIGTIRDYQVEAFKNVMAQIPALIDVEFTSLDYRALIIPPRSIVYCDPPYQNTTEYKGGFDHDAFWQWCREKTLVGHRVFVSEYAAPIDFECIWEKPVKSSLSANGIIGGSKKSIEKLFIWKKIFE